MQQAAGTGAQDGEQAVTIEEALDIARKIYTEIDTRKPDAVVALSPISAFLLRHVYPETLGVSSPPNIFTLPEAILAKLVADPSFQPMRRSSALLVLTYAEAYQLHSQAAREILVRAGVSCPGFPEHQPFHRQSFPEGWLPDRIPGADLWIGKRIAQWTDIKPPDAIVCTGAFALKTLKEACPDTPVMDWSSFVLENLAGSACGLPLGDGSPVR